MAVPLKRIRDLLARAQSPNEHEADTARKFATELMHKHGVSEDDILGAAMDSVELSPDRPGSQRFELARVVAKSRDTVATSSGPAFTFRGYPEAAKDARELFCALVRIVESSCEMSHSADDKDRFLWRMCFWLGFVSGVQKQLDPEHGSVPPEALASIVAKSRVPPDVQRAAEGLDETRDREIRQPAFSAGLQLGSMIQVPPYRRKR